MFQFFGDEVKVPLYRLRRVLDPEVAEWMEMWGVADAAAAAPVSLEQLLADDFSSSDSGGSNGSSSAGGGGGNRSNNGSEALVELWALSSLVLRAGSAAPALDACGAWMFDPVGDGALRASSQAPRSPGSLGLATPKAAASGAPSNMNAGPVWAHTLSHPLLR